MPAYLLADIELHDAARYKEYVEHVPALIEKFGGRYLVRGGPAQVLEGNWSPSRLIIIEFPDRDAVLGFYEDPEYVPYRDLRQSIASTDLLLADGVD